MVSLWKMHRLFGLPKNVSSPEKRFIRNIHHKYLDDYNKIILIIFVQ